MDDGGFARRETAHSQLMPVVIELPEQPCPYGNTVRDANKQHVPCGVKVDWQDGESPDFLYCGQCSTDYAAQADADGDL